MVADALLHMDMSFGSLRHSGVGMQFGEGECMPRMQGRQGAALGPGQAPGEGFPECSRRALPLSVKTGSSGCGFGEP